MINRLYVLIYVIISFITGFLRYLKLFKKQYDLLGNYDGLHKPRFEFGFASMVLQGIIASYLYPVIGNNLLFFVITFALWFSFMGLAEVGKHYMSNIGLFLLLQIGYTSIQIALVTLAFFMI